MDIEIRESARPPVIRCKEVWLPVGDEERRFKITTFTVDNKTVIYVTPHYESAG